MHNIQTVCLELLRHGPQHNQLLSPLTDYLGLCGNHGAATIHIDYEHQALEQDLRSLLYKDTSSKAAENNHELKPEATAERLEALERIAEKITAILNANPGLAPQLNAVSTGKLIHLQLILSASELALLPFELAKVPDGCIGSSTNWLSLQSEVEICLTRQVRGVDTTAVNWNRKPRILFAWAGVSKELAARHIRQIVAALKHWLPANLEEDAQILTELGKHITVLENVTLEKLHTTCRKNNFTHVHLLAHGKKDAKKPGNPVGLLLHSNEHTGYEVVGSNQLATALTNKENSGCKTGLRPLVVVLASCNSGHIQDVAFRDNSLAHELHQAGIPLVIASQFPLSVRGAELMCGSLYEQMLWGEDPRCTLIKIRKKLHTDIDPFHHDWAALVAYASFPRDFDEQLVAFRYRQSKRAIDNALASLDIYLDPFKKKLREVENNSGNRVNSITDDQVQQQEKIDALLRLLKSLSLAEDRLPDERSYRTEILGLQGAVTKRRAEVFFYCSRIQTRIVSNEKKEHQKDSKNYYDRQSIALLYESMQFYERAANESIREAKYKIRKKRSLHWTLTQYLSLHLVLFGELDERAWDAAYFAAEVDMKNGSIGSEDRLWACASAAELNFIKYCSICGQDGPEEDNNNQEKTEVRIVGEAKKLACELFKYSRDDLLLTSSTRRQFRRYVDWWGKKNFPLCPKDGPKNCGSFPVKALELAESLSRILNNDPTTCF